MDKEDMEYIYSKEYYSAMRMKEILSFVTTWMNLEGIILSDISQRQILCDTTYMWNLKAEFIKTV